MPIFNSYVKLPEGKRKVAGWVAGIMTLLVMTGIIHENSLRKTHQ